MHWRRVLAAACLELAEFLEILAEEVNPPPPPKIRERKPMVPKAPKPSWYDSQ